MTLKECRDAAIKGKPVIHLSQACAYKSRVRYTRISQVGVDINEKGKESPFVQLFDVSGNSVSYARPEDVILESEYWEKERARNNV